MVQLRVQLYTFSRRWLYIMTAITESDSVTYNSILFSITVVSAWHSQIPLLNAVVKLMMVPMFAFADQARQP